jgi:PUB domain
MGRVQWVLETYDFLKHHMIVGDATTTTTPTTTNGDGEEAPTTTSSSTTTTTNLLQQLQDRYQQQVQREQEEQIRQEQERIRHEDEARREQWRRQQEEQAIVQAERDREHQRQEEQRAQLRIQAELARQRRLAQERAEQEWFDGIPKGVEGVRQQLGVLQESTKDHEEDPPRAYKTAIQSLYTLFQQINAHPEETKFRRIRREHEQFQADIGRYKGGVELLIAAGFTLGAIDDVPWYISKEPDIEKDMDGWSDWFDVLKGTLQLLEDEMIKKSY